MQPKKTRRINVNLTALDHKKLHEIKEKYHLSYSTIANILINWYAFIVPKDEYIYKDNDKERKTSIKPRTPSTQKVYTNVIKLFTRNGLRDYILKQEGKPEDKQKIYDKIMDGIYKQFKETYDENWNGNQQTRSFAKFIKKNPEYVKRLLDE